MATRAIIKLIVIVRVAQAMSQWHGDGPGALQGLWRITHWHPNHLGADGIVTHKLGMSTRFRGARGARTIRLRAQMPCPWGPIAAPKVLLKPLPPGESEAGRPEHSAQSLCPQESGRVRGQVCGRCLSCGLQAAVQILVLLPPYWGPQGHCLQNQSQCHKEVAHRLRFPCYPMLPSYRKVEKRLYHLLSERKVTPPPTECFLCPGTPHPWSH